MRDGNAGGAHHVLGAILLHRERRSEDARMGVGNAQHLEHALDDPVLAEAAVQRIEGDLGFYARKYLGDVPIYVDRCDDKSLLFQGLGAGGA